MDKNKAYWNTRFLKEGKIWGEFPSKSALCALELFKKYKIQKILIPGSGYGRHTKFFSKNNYKVIGIEISDIAIEMAKKFDSRTEFFNCSVLDMEFIDEYFDAIYCFNTLHLFLRDERLLFLRKCFDQLIKNGLNFLTVFSERESSFGQGKELEMNTFESNPGGPTHYFTEKDLIEQFKNYNILETGILKEQENHGEKGSHIHLLRYIFAQKRI
ncbi:MAG: class I SAM-dependent methyltransferase [Candidatus Thorarchaeota archaeon]